jgi:hypothetical protein
MSKKIKFMSAVFFAVFFCVAVSQAALVELQVGGSPLPATVAPGPGSLAIDVILTDLQGVAAIDGFNLFMGVSGTGANSLGINPTADSEPSYIFPSSFSYLTTSVSALSVAAAGSSNDTGTTGMLAQLAFDYDGILGELYTFALVDASQNFGTLTGASDFPLTLCGNTEVLVTPIPGAIWLLGGGLLGLINIRRRTKE